MAVVTVLRASVSDSVSVLDLLKAHKSVVGSKAWLVEAAEWEGIIVGRVKDAKHVQMVAGLGDGGGGGGGTSSASRSARLAQQMGLGGGGGCGGAGGGAGGGGALVRMDVVESVVEAAEAVVKYLDEAPVWNRRVYQRLETVALLKRATAESGVACTEVEEAAQRLELASQWLVEAPQVKAVLDERVRTLAAVKAAVAEFNVKPSDVDAALQLVQGSNGNIGHGSGGGNGGGGGSGKGHALAWVEPAQASEWESRVMERVEALGFIDRALSENVADASSVEGAAEVVVANVWIAEPMASQWRGRLADRVDDIRCIRSALSDSVLSAELDNAAIVVEDAMVWLEEARGAWRDEIAARTDQVLTLYNTAINDSLVLYHW
jgi:hypothetical protein